MKLLLLSVLKLFNIINLVLIRVNDVNFSKNLAAVFSNLCVKYCKNLIKFVCLCQFMY